ncbi:hypothetical protein Mgra_00006995 [Meloidogyne graminicola]|uniref:L-Fucosyltransferase n=1 Tax=Meloidogyne graminicola TaxID=189291 RepID=A0A8S9ZJQ9_9BILA|nr:hypothetical protein Mgra_00006995 [Meloidogyne graminicola]
MELPKEWKGECGGLANQLWRLAVLFSIAKSLDRIPAISNSSTWTCDKLNSPNEIQNTFPNVYSTIYYLQADPLHSVYDESFKKYCCEYINVTERFGNYTKTNLIIPPPPQSPKYLEGKNAEIKHLFKFSKKIVFRVISYINELFGNDDSHKFCVHTRRGDFGTQKWPMHARSEKMFIEPAIKFIIEFLPINYQIFNFSIVLLGEDKNFIKQINIPKNQVNKIYFPKKMVRTYDLCFGVWACDSLLITASSSTFGWWLAYLLQQENAPIFYNANFTNSNYNKTNFPDEWFPLKLDHGMNKILME